MTENKKRPIVLVCTGLGRIQRGFEMYIASLANKLAASKTLSTPFEVWTGGNWDGNGVKSRKISNLGRNSSWLKKRENAFIWEQRSFALGMLPLLFAKKPTAIYLGEYQLYCWLFKIRQLFRLRFSLVLYTGGQAIPGLFNPALDYVHHVTDVYIKECNHIPRNRQCVLPHFIEEDFTYDNKVQETIRQKAGNKKIVLSVGLIDNNVKRMGLLIDALKPLAEDVYPVLLGQFTKDTAELKQMMKGIFGKNGFVMDTIPHAQLGNWYYMADLFVLCSPKESFGLAMVEALHHGLPVICDDFAEARFVLGPYGTFIVMKNAAVLTEAIKDQVFTPTSNKVERKQYTTTRFTWDNLREAYRGMFDSIVNNKALHSGSSLQYTKQ